MSVIIGLVLIILYLCIFEPDSSGNDDYHERSKSEKVDWGGRCNGDCENCPPHYGYRYGRYYYGHDHHHGCEFGGNRCGGSMDQGKGRKNMLNILIISLCVYAFFCLMIELANSVTPQNPQTRTNSAAKKTSAASRRYSRSGSGFCSGSFGSGGSDRDELTTEDYIILDDIEDMFDRQRENQ